MMVLVRSHHRAAFTFDMEILAGRPLCDRRDIDVLARRLGVRAVDAAMLDLCIRRAYRLEWPEPVSSAKAG